MDIEGEEYKVIEDVLDSGVEVSQILVEFHNRFSRFSVSDTKKAIKRMNQRGYKIFYISSTGREVSLVSEEYI